MASCSHANGVVGCVCTINTVVCVTDMGSELFSRPCFGRTCSPEEAVCAVSVVYQNMIATASPYTYYVATCYSKQAPT